MLRRPNPKDPHGQHDSVLIKPPKEDDSLKIECATVQLAKHYGACLALFRFANNLNIKMTLPPDIRDYWHLLEKWKAASPKNKAWLFDTDPFTAAPSLAPSVKNANGTPTSDRSRPPSPKIPKYWLEAPEVRMAPTQRQKVQDLIQSHMDVLDDGTRESDSTPIDDASAQALIRNLLHLGFRQSHAEKAVKYLQQARSKSDPVSHHLCQLPLQDAAVEYLQLLLSEDDLPQSFRQSHSTLANARIASQADSASLARSWVVERINKDYGYPSAIVEVCLNEAEGNEAVCLDLLLQRLVGKRTTVVAKDQGDLEAQEEELVTLESIYADRFVNLGDGKLEINICLPQASSSRRAPDDLALFVWLHSSSAYPSASPNNMPTFACKSSTLPAYIRLHLCAILEARLQDPDLQDLRTSGGVVSELVEALACADHVIANPPDPASVFQHLIATKRSTLAATASSETKNLRKSRTVNRKPAGDSATLRSSLEALTTTPAYQKMLAKRKTLPAWSLKEQIVHTIDESRITLVMGETGSGKTTQVPAYVLDDAIESGKGADCHILVTQVRTMLSFLLKHGLISCNFSLVVLLLSVLPLVRYDCKD